MSLSILILQSLQNEESLQSKLSEHTCDLQRARSCNPLQSISRWAPCNTEQYVHAVFKVLHESAWPPMSDNFDSFFFYNAASRTASCRPSAWVEPVFCWFQPGSAQHVTIRSWRLWSLAWPSMSDTLNRPHEWNLSCDDFRQAPRNT